MKSEFEDKYSDTGFWDKVSDSAKSAGREAIEKALTLYYVMTDKGTSVANKAIAVGALGYFISPVDAIPDVIAGLGYTDDVGVMIAALTALSTSITDEIKKKSADKTKEWLD